MKYRNFDLRVASDHQGWFAVHACSPSGDAHGRLSLDPGACLSDEVAARRERPPQTSSHRDLSPSEHGLSPPIREPGSRLVGTCLFEALINGDVLALFDRCRGEATSTGEGVRVRLCLNPRDSCLARIASFPWELLYDPRVDQFLVLDPRTSVVRLYDAHHRPEVSPAEPPLRVLLAGAEVPGLQPLDLAHERRAIHAAVSDRSDVLVESLPHATRARLLDRLQEHQVSVLHLMMHGTFAEGDQKGQLAFEDGDGEADLVSGSDLSRQLRSGAPPRLVVLNTCLSATASTSNALTSVASALVLGGCPAVVAMTSKIDDAAAIAFSSRLYTQLARGDCLDEAMAKARVAVDAEVPSILGEWSMPALFLSPQAVAVLPPTTPSIPHASAEAGHRVDSQTQESLEAPQTGCTFTTTAQTIDKQISVNAPGGTISIQ